MPSLRLEFDLDSDVYPELYAALSLLGTARGRGERLRVLAAAGLVWENVRVHGAAAIGPTPQPSALALAPASGIGAGTAAFDGATTSPAAAVPLAPVAAAVPPTLSVVPERPPADKPRRTRATAARRPPPDPRGADFIDLAIDAPPPAPEALADFPEPSAADVRNALEPRTLQRLQLEREAEQVARELPVLMDVVAEDDVIADGAPLDPVAAPALPAAAVAAAVAGAIAADRAGAEAGADAQAAAGQGTPREPGEPGEGGDVIHLTTLAQKPATRSRLMRMKDKGLFKNG